jgi:hypothetical protein
MSGVVLAFYKTENTKIGTFIIFSAFVHVYHFFE